MSKALTYYRPEEVVKNELYSTQVSEIEVTPDMFHNITGSLSPKKGLTNKIAAAAGVSFLPNIRMSDVYGDVIINPDGSQIKKLVGIRCTKQGQKVQPDGSLHVFSPCTYEFNWEDRAELDFIADEKKYKTDIQKRKHLLELKKFASQRASTGAELMVIREATGMPTGFKKQELEEAGGIMRFSQVVKSRAHQEALVKASIDNIRSGGAIASSIDETAGLLTGSTPDSSEDFNNVFERPEKPEEKLQPTEKTTSPVNAYKPPIDPIVEQETIKDKVNSLLDRLQVDNQDAYDFYSSTINENSYSEEVCNWAIGDIMKVFPELKV